MSVTRLFCMHRALWSLPPGLKSGAPGVLAECSARSLITAHESDTYEQAAGSAFVCAAGWNEHCFAANIFEVIAPEGLPRYALLNAEGKLALQNAGGYHHIDRTGNQTEPTLVANRISH